MMEIKQVELLWLDGKEWQVVFMDGTCAPWDVPDDMSISVKSEDDARRLKAIIERFLDV